MFKDLEIKENSEINLANVTAWLVELTATCNTLDVSAMMDFFTDDAFADRGPLILEGRSQIDDYLRPLYARFTHYELTKTLRAIDGDQIIVDTRLKWKMAEHERMQHTRALEILSVRNWKIYRWDNSAISWE